MSENKHTPEPWRVEIGEQPESIAVLCTCGLAHFEIVSDSQLGDIHADARRIVACVNACAGCATEVLETAPVGFFNSTYGHPKYLEEITKQRDELLAATEAIAINSEECLDFDECTAMLVSIDDYHKLMEAVARAKGEQ